MLVLDERPPDGMLILVANSVFAQCSHEIRPESGWIGGFQGRIDPFASRGRRSGESATSINVGFMPNEHPTGADHEG